MEVYIPSEKTFRRAGGHGGGGRGRRSRFDWRYLALGAAVLAVIVALVFWIGSCFGGKQVKVVTTEQLADSALFTQLADAYHQETGQSLKADRKDLQDIQAQVNQDKAACVLAPLPADIGDKISQGVYGGYPVFYDTYLIVGPKDDPARVKHLGKYKAQDVLKHLNLLEKTFVHPAKGSELQTRLNTLLQQAGLEAGDWYVEAADDGAQMLQMAKDKGGYAFISRENWAAYGAQFPELEVLNQRLSGLVDQYYLLAKPNAKEGETSPANAFLEWMKGDTARNIVQAYKLENAQTPVFELNEPGEVIEKPKEI